jgi:hypothetical protein
VIEVIDFNEFNNIFFKKISYMINKYKNYFKIKKILKDDIKKKSLKK